MGATLLGLTSVLPSKVTPSSMASLADRISPNNSVLALISIRSLAVTLPLILPRSTTEFDVEVALDDRVVAQVEGTLRVDVPVELSVEG